MAVRTYGMIEFIEATNTWEIMAAEPHICMHLKRTFEWIPKSQTVPYVFRNTPENCHDLLWFLFRYPLSISPKNKARMEQGSEQYVDERNKLDAILLPDYKPRTIKLKKPHKARDYQLKGAEFHVLNPRFLLGDDLGTGKTLTGILTFFNPGTLPGVVVVQTHMPKQWKEDGIEKFTNLKAHIIEKTKPYSLPKADIYIFKYTQMAGWADIFQTGIFQSAVFDEVQELRRKESQRYAGAKVLANNVISCIGMSATPIYNYGDEIFNILDLLKPGCLGDRFDFLREWATARGNDKWLVTDPPALGSHLRERHLMLRRTRTEIGRELPPLNTIVQTVDYDHEAAKNAEEIAYKLAIKVTSASFVERGQAARELDAYVRHETGVAKAKDVAAFVRIILESGEPVVLAGWHRDVYEIWKTELAEFNPVFFTGTEGAAAKQKSKDAFVSGETNLFIISLRSGIGLDGLQHRCRTVVIGELDWSPQVHNQVVGRVDRDGQQDQVTVYYLVTEFGSDPVMIDVLGLKSSQAAGIIDPMQGAKSQHSDDSRIRVLAESFIQKHKHGR